LGFKHPILKKGGHQLLEQNYRTQTFKSSSYHLSAVHGSGEKTTTQNEIQILIAELLLSQKARDLVLYEHDEDGFTDYSIIVSGTSSKHVQGMALRLRQLLRKKGCTPLSFSGLDTGNWILIDCGSVLVHLFHEESRVYYDLDTRLSEEAHYVVLPTELEAERKSLNTGLFAIHRPVVVNAR
jgi:ribosome-associated protein